MISDPLAPYQTELIERPLSSKIFLEGQAGSGKTTVGVERMLRLLRSGISASELLIMVPQRTLGAPYQAALQASDHRPGGQVTLLTVGGLARRMVDLYWPIVAGPAGFARTDHPPSFLTLETSLYYMAHLVRPLLDRGLFDSVTIDRNRIFSQVLDNLNKAAIVGFPYTEIGERLKAASMGDTAQSHVYEDAQHCATLFREYCLQNNLLDFSLQVEVFQQYLWNAPICRDNLRNAYRHLIYDNLEEDNPTAHDLLREWLPDFDSALLIYDSNAGYRSFLGASPSSGARLVEVCDEHHIFTDTLVTPPALRSFAGQIGRAMERDLVEDTPLLPSEAYQEVVQFPEKPLRFYPQMLDWVATQVDGLIKKGTPPEEIVILAPYLPDSLRFALQDRLQARGIPYRSHRPSRSLRDEPAAQALLTLAALGHPAWGIRPSRFELAYAFIQTIQDLDLVRAQVLVDAVQRSQAGTIGLAPFEKIAPQVQERVTYYVGNRYDAIRRWLEEYASDPAEEIDFFFSRLFGEVLSQAGFAFHNNYEAGRVCANLIESARKFRWAVGDKVPVPAGGEMYDAPLGKEYLRMIQDGILAAQYIESWQIPPENAVLLAPAYTFLLANQPVEYQFWLDAGSTSWSERLYQPLTHPFVLTRDWDPNRLWTDADDFEYNRENLYRVILGLVRRCRSSVYLGLCELSESGYESRGMLLRALYVALRQSRGYVA